MNQEQRLAFFMKLHILKKLLNENQKSAMEPLFAGLLYFYNDLLLNNIEFDIKYLSYDFLLNSHNSNMLTSLSRFKKRQILGFIDWMKRIYVFDHNVYSEYDNNKAFFSNKDSTLSITKGDITVNFSIQGDLLRYDSYIINNNEHSITEIILFQLETFENFISNLEEYYHLDKCLLSMIFLV